MQHHAGATVTKLHEYSELLYNPRFNQFSSRPGVAGLQDRTSLGLYCLSLSGLGGLLFYLKTSHRFLRVRSLIIYSSTTFP